MTSQARPFTLRASSEPGTYAVEIDGTEFARVERYRQRTPVHDHNALVGYAERDAWKLRPTDGAWVDGFRTRRAALAHLEATLPRPEPGPNLDPEALVGRVLDSVGTVEEALAEVEVALEAAGGDDALRSLVVEEIDAHFAAEAPDLLGPDLGAALDANHRAPTPDGWAEAPLVRLVHTDDPHTALRPGSVGWCLGVALGHTYVRWADGSTLSLLADSGDRWDKVSPSEVPLEQLQALSLRLGWPANHLLLVEAVKRGVPGAGATRGGRG